MCVNEIVLLSVDPNIVNTALIGTVTTASSAFQSKIMNGNCHKKASVVIIVANAASNIVALCIH